MGISDHFHWFSVMIIGLSKDLLRRLAENI